MQEIFFIAKLRNLGISSRIFKSMFAIIHRLYILPSSLEFL